MFKRHGEGVSAESVLRMFAERQNTHGVPRTVVHRDSDGTPCPARKVIHRGGMLKKSRVPLFAADADGVGGEGRWEKKAAILLRALSCVWGFASQPFEIQSEAGIWIPDYGGFLVGHEPFLVENKTLEWLDKEETARLRDRFRQAKALGFRPVLWSDRWLSRNALVENLAFLFKYRDWEVDESIGRAVHQLLKERTDMTMTAIASLRNPSLVNSVYALLAQGQVQTDLTLPLAGAATVLRIATNTHGDIDHGSDQFFPATGFLAGW